MTTRDFQTRSPMRIFLSYFRPHRGLFLLDMTCAFFISLVDLAFPLISRTAMYHWLPDKRYSVFFTVMAIVLIAFVIRSILFFVVCYWGHTFGIRVEADIRRDLFAHMQELGFDFYDKNRTGQLMSRLTTDLFELTELAHHGPEDLFISIVTIVGALAVMFTIQWRMALVVSVILPVFVLTVMHRRRSMGRASRAAKQKTGADFVLINPVHAAEPVSPLTPSPYLPVSRRLINFTYIRPEAIAEYATLSEGDKNAVDGLHADTEPLNGDSQLIDRDAMWRSKMHALWIIFKAGRTAERQSVFDQFKADCGSDLEAYATWCLCYDKWGAPNGEESNWERKFNRNSPEIANLRKQYPDTLDFYRWLEWIAAEQLSSAQQAAKDAGMHIGIMSDMAVGVHPSGADVWWNPERFAKGATVGAPPDMFNQQGQNWSQPPLSPINLETTGYEAYRNMVHGMFARAGAVRIDHILGLFRLWWIPENRSAMDGAYVYYDSDIMLGVLAIEASRAGGVVVGEDLGVVPDHVADSLSSHGILGCAVEWFEQCDGVFRAPSQWRPYALASVNTHDLPPAAGYLEYEHVKIRERLGLLTGPAEEFEASAKAEQDAMLAMLVEQGYLDADFAEHREDHEADIVDALYHALKGSPCKLLAASITDAVGEKRAQNQPGTNNEYPNWRIPLADAKGNVVPLETLFDTPGAQRFAQIFNS